MARFNDRGLHGLADEMRRRGKIISRGLDTSSARLPRRHNRIPQQQGRTLVEPRRRHIDSRAFSLGVSSRADRLADARRRHRTRLTPISFMPCARGSSSKSAEESRRKAWIVEQYCGCGCPCRWSMWASAAYFIRPRAARTARWIGLLLGLIGLARSHSRPLHAGTVIFHRSQGNGAGHHRNLFARSAIRFIFPERFFSSGMALSCLAPGTC